jgi:iron(III) transport system ATP-binding protein
LEPNQLTPYSIHLTHVTKHYNQVCAVNTLSLAVNQGEFLVFLGSSGCGKTTTLRLIAGLELPDSGTIHISGQLVAGAGVAVPPEKRRVGMVFQDYALFPHLNVGENVAFGIQAKRAEKMQRVKVVLAQVGLSGYETRMPYELSGGQQQRVALARALAPQPDILLLDEPFSNLDTALRAQVRAEVRHILQQTGATAIFVTHDQTEALSLSDKIAIMFDGTIVQFDTPQSMYTRPATKAIAQFIGEANFVPAHANGTRAQCALGEMTLLTPAQGAVELLIRPEMLHLHPADEGVPAQVLWSEYYGHYQRIGIVLADNTSLVVRTDSQVLHKTGDTVRVRVYAPLWRY